MKLIQNHSGWWLNQVLLNSNWWSRTKLMLQTSWWFQPIWKICSSNWIISPGIRDENKKYLKPPPSTRLERSNVYKSCANRRFLQIQKWIASISAKPCWTLRHQLGDVSWDRYRFLIKLCPKNSTDLPAASLQMFQNLSPGGDSPKETHILNHPEMKKDSHLNQTSRGGPGLHSGGACSIFVHQLIQNFDPPWHSLTDSICWGSQFLPGWTCYQPFDL